MFAKLLGPYLFQGYCGTLRENFQLRMQSLSGLVNALPEQEVLNGDVGKLAQPIIRQQLGEELVLSDETPARVGDIQEKPLPSNARKTAFYIHFLIKFSGPADYFKWRPENDWPDILIPVKEITPHGFLLEVLAYKLDTHDITQLLATTKRDLQIMFEEVNSLVIDFNGQVRRTVPNLILDRRQKILAACAFKHALPFPVFTLPKKEKAPHMSQRRSVFMSYSHEDEELLRELNQHLSQLKREQFIECWDDRHIPAGGDINLDVVKKIEAADIILFLISKSFMSSDYIWREEVSRAIKRHEVGQAIVIPIILRDCDWHTAPFGKLKALPKDGKAVTSSFWKNHDAAFADVAKGLRTLIENTPLQPKPTKNENSIPVEVLALCYKAFATGEPQHIGFTAEHVMAAKTLSAKGYLDLDANGFLEHSGGLEFAVPSKCPLTPEGIEYLKRVQPEDFADTEIHQLLRDVKAIVL